MMCAVDNQERNRQCDGYLANNFQYHALSLVYTYRQKHSLLKVLVLQPFRKICGDVPLFVAMQPHKINNIGGNNSNKFRVNIVV